MGRTALRRGVSVILLAGTGLSIYADAVGTNDEHWVATWSATLHEPSPGPPGLTNPGFENQTLRQIVHTSIGGDRVRVRLSTFGAAALVIGAAHIALRDAGAGIVPGSDRTLTFGGQPSIVIPAGAVVLSDPVDLDVPALRDVAVSVFVPEAPDPRRGTSWRYSRRTSHRPAISRHAPTCRLLRRPRHGSGWRALT